MPSVFGYDDCCDNREFCRNSGLFDKFDEQFNKI